jgi:biopolymer transport protein ExbD
MKFGSARRADEEHLTLQMTPMIDVIFQLIIFFMCVMRFRLPEAQQMINLPVEGRPQVGVTSNLPDVPLILRRNPRGTPGTEGYFPIVRLRDSAITSWEGLQESLKVLKVTNPEVHIVLDIAPDVVHDSVVKAIDQCAGAEVRNVSFAQPRQPGGP